MIRRPPGDATDDYSKTSNAKSVDDQGISLQGGNEAFARPRLTAGKWLAIVTVTAMAVGMLVSFFLTYLNTTLSR